MEGITPTYLGGYIWGVLCVCRMPVATPVDRVYREVYVSGEEGVYACISHAGSLNGGDERGAVTSSVLGGFQVH